MTISTFANELEPAGLNGYQSIRRLHRERKRVEAEERQAAFDAEVTRVAREQNIDRLTALDVVRRRHRHEHRTTDTRDRKATR